MRDRRIQAVCGYEIADLLRRVEVAAHQRQLLGQGDQLDGPGCDVRLFDQQPAAGLEHAYQLGHGQARVGEVMQGVDDQHPVKVLIGKGQALGVGLNGTGDALELSLSEHRRGQVANHQPADKRQQRGCDSPRPASRIQQPAGSGQAEQLAQARRIGRRDGTVVETSQQVKMEVHATSRLAVRDSTCLGGQVESRHQGLTGQPRRA